MRATLLLAFALACSSQAAPTTAPPPPPFDATPTTAEIGAPAPDFVLPDPDGALTRLSDHRGKVVVLEWFNPDCPFIVSAHEDGPLKAMPQRWHDAGVVWLTVNSNAEGTQGNGASRNRKAKDQYTLPRPVLLDESGQVGRAYGAKTTPHIYIVDPEGSLVYVGGLDNAPMGRAKDGAVKAWADEAIQAVVSGGQPASPRTKPYGCSVKYKS